MNPTWLAVCALTATLVAAPTSAQVIGPPQPTVTRDTIRAEREKYDRELKLDTKRPWDGWSREKQVPALPSPAPALNSK